MKTNSYPRETVEFQPLIIKKDGVIQTAGVSTSIVAHGARPTVWTTAVVLGLEVGVMISGLTPGMYDIYAKITDSPEIPVMDCGTIAIT